MKKISTLQSLQTIVLLGMAMVCPPGSAQEYCTAPSLSNQQVARIIEEERAMRSDLPLPFSEYRWVVRKQRCHYVYIEYGLPAAPEYNHLFRLNQHGVIVDVQTGTSKQPINCPGGIFTEAQLAQIVSRARKVQDDIPAPFSSYTTRADRLRCLWLYFEYNQPERPGDYLAFTIDPFGELMGFQLSRPY